MSKTTKFVSLNKQSKKKQKEYYSSKRGSWYGINPVTRVVPDKTKYNRKKLSKKFDSFDLSLHQFL